MLAGEDVMNALIAAAGLMVLPMLGHAAEIKVLSVIPLKTSIEELGPPFERATGHKLVVEYDGSSQLKRRLEAGEAFDIALIYPELIDALVKQGKLAEGTSTAIARVLIAVAVKKGAPKPDISTVDGFKRTLLNARSISHSADGGSGIYFKNLIERLGIAADVKSKLRPMEGGHTVVGPVVRGEAELAVITTPFIAMEPGADLVGPLPDELQHVIVYTAAIGSGSKQPEPAKALIQHLTTPESAKLLKSKGLDSPVP
jgi:molybdate transport system substrate-binding protein